MYTTANNARYPAYHALSICIILAVGFILRVYKLDCPSYIWEELLVPLTAHYPYSYIFNWSSTVETHPPVFHFLIKSVMLISNSEFMLRFPSVLFGVLGIYLMYRVGQQIISTEIGLLSAALISVNPVLIDYSRKVRPYSLWLCLFLVSVIFLYRFVKEFKTKDALIVVVCNCALLWVHYVSLVVIVAQGLVVSGFYLKRFRQGGGKGFLCYCAGSIVCAASVMQMVYSTILNRKYFEVGYTTFSDVFYGISLSAMELVTYHFVPLSVSILCITVGAIIIFVKNKSICIVGLVFVFVPLVEISILRVNWFGPQYIEFMLPFFVVYMSALIALMLRATILVCIASVAISVFGMLNVFMYHYNTYYSENSYNFGVNKQRDYAHFVNTVPKENLFATCSMANFNALNWYLEHFSNNALTHQIVREDDQTATVNLIRIGGGCSASEMAQFEKLGTPFEVASAPDISLYRWSVPRQPRLSIAALPARISLPSTPDPFYRNVFRAENVVLHPMWGGLLTPSSNNVPASLEYVFVNDTGEGKHSIAMDFQFGVTGKGNSFQVLYKFDDGDYNEAFSSAQTLVDNAHVVFDRQLPYREFHVKIVMLCTEATAAYPGGNQETISLKSVDVIFSNGAAAHSDTISFDMMRPHIIQGDCRITGLSPFELSQETFFRWGLGPETTVEFTLDEPRKMFFSTDFISFVPFQEVVIEANGILIDSLSIPEYHNLNFPPTHKMYVFDGRSGKNTLTLRYKFWNNNLVDGNPAQYMQAITLPVAIYFSKFQLIVD